MPVMREDTRPLGVVYTPPEVARPMVRLVVDPRARGKSAAEILSLRVCDPSVGAGAFVIEVVDALADHLVEAWSRESRVEHESPEARNQNADRAARDLIAAAAPPLDRATWPAAARRRIASTCIAGVDVDPAAIVAARRALGLDDGPQPATDSGAQSLRVADALDLDWHAAYPEIFARGGFDLFVGNPPYIRQEQLGGKAALRKYASYDGVADLYVYFIELAHRVLRPGGAYCLIVPNKWLTAAYGRPLRTFLAEQRSIDGVVDLGRSPLFEDADAFPSIAWGTVNRTTGRASGSSADAHAPIVAVRAAIGSTVADVLATATTDPGSAQDRGRWGAGPWHIDRPSERTLLDRIERAWPPLGEIVKERPSRGVVTGCNRAFVIDRATRARILDAEPAAAELVRPFVKGRDLAPYRIIPGERWILLIDRGTNLDELPVVRAHLEAYREVLEPKPPGWTGAWRGRKPGTYAWHELQDPVGPLIKARAPRLLYQDIQTTPACVLDRDGEIVPDTTVWMLPTDDRFLLAVLGSPLYGWYARRRFPPALNGAMRPKGEYMRTLPIAQPDVTARRAITELVERRSAVAEDAILDAAIARAVCDVYELTATERALIAAS